MKMKMRESIIERKNEGMFRHEMSRKNEMQGGHKERERTALRAPLAPRRPESLSQPPQASSSLSSFFPSPHSSSSSWSRPPASSRRPSPHPHPHPPSPSPSPSLSHRTVRPRSRQHPEQAWAQPDQTRRMTARPRASAARRARALRVSLDARPRGGPRAGTRTRRARC